MENLTTHFLQVLSPMACASCTAEKEANYQVIPLPQEVSLTQGNPFKLNENVLIAYPENNALLQRNAEFLSGVHPTSHELRTENKGHRGRRTSEKCNCTGARPGHCKQGRLCADYHP